jgi:PadR family transcriptional regulator, regulatory protein PadR
MTSPEQLKGHLDGLILAVLRDRQLHGYAVIEELKLRSAGDLDLPEGTVYPALHRLEGDGLLSSKWSAESGRRRRVYTVTDKGQKALQRKRSDWRAFATTIETVLG